MPKADFDVQCYAVKNQMCHLKLLAENMPSIRLPFKVPVFCGVTGQLIMAPKGELFHIFKGLLCLCYFLPWILVQDIHFQTNLLTSY